MAGLSSLFRLDLMFCIYQKIAFGAPKTAPAPSPEDPKLPATPGHSGTGPEVKNAVLCPNFRKIRAQYSTLSESLGTVQHSCGSRCPGNCRFAANCRSAGNCRFAANCRLRRLASFSGFGDCPPFPASAAAPFCAAPDPTFSSGNFMRADPQIDGFGSGSRSPKYPDRQTGFGAENGTWVSFADSNCDLVWFPDSYSGQTESRTPPEIDILLKNTILAFICGC